MNVKKLAAEKAVEYIRDGMIVGLGTGSTAFWAIQKIGERVRQGLSIKAVASSKASEKLAAEAGIPMASFSDITFIDVTIDGADEADEKHNLIKGGGGALLREKIIAGNSRQFIVIVDESKLVSVLGKFPLPVEIVPFAFNLTLNRLTQLECDAAIRMNDGEKFITDNGNFIADCSFNKITDAHGLNLLIHQIPGVVESGLFFHTMVSAIIVGYENGEVKTLL